ncbi:Cyanovirin-N [Massarina eburnea CBS 473.64]|uniref:Cyanovirin-N n=1 Tax=Massarina eburnea CBS 473.64 TaxID=1395130 RepID=A0A6A6RM58_9PLEO|nr:Cyanovirin-N [Massarina eburnea CBS 473.64]
MLSTSALASLAAFLAVANAAPALAPRDGTIASQCTNVKLSQNWLVGDCLTGVGTTRITSGTSLNSKISNDDGALTWALDGWFSQLCDSCQLLDGGSSLNCQCPPSSGQNKNTTIDLDEHISVYSGHLLSDLNGTPVVPVIPSIYDFPSDVSYGYGGNATCVEGSANPDWCGSVVPLCSDGDKTDFNETAFTYTTPITSCLAPSFYLPYEFQFDHLKLAGAAAWELTGYADAECTEKVIVLTPDDSGKCNLLPELVRGVTSRPLFNGDVF